MRRIRKIIIALGGLFVVLALVSAAVAYWAASELSRPPRRDLMDYHREFLDRQPSHGVRVDTFTASDGTPCLLVSPAGHPGDRGRLVRDQLTARHIVLPSFGTVNGTLVLLHGRKGRKEDYLPVAERFCAVGFRCLIPDLPAHGDHPVDIATFGLREKNLPARILADAETQFGLARQPAGLMGLSMGGSVAVHAASLSDQPWKALVVVASFDRLNRIVDLQAAGLFGDTAGHALANAADSIYQYQSGHSITEIQPWARASTIGIPTLIAHGTADHTVPVDAARHLYDSLQNAPAKRWITIPGADHDRVLVTSYPIYADIAEWMIRHVR